MADKVKIGIIGCGNISNAYFKGAGMFDVLEIAACADIDRAAAEAKGKEHGVPAVAVDALLADPTIQIAVNLTTPQAHVEVSLAALEAGKHVHLEKPLAVTYEDGRRLIEQAAAKHLRVSCAPDTFLGGAHQTCRKLVDDGLIGRPVAGTAFMMCPGHESWHPNPGFYYLKGGGPMLDMGPYYLTALVNMLGPVRRVCGITGAALEERIATCKARKGERLPVEVPTHQAGVLEFRDGAIVSIVMSFDVKGHKHSPIEVYGTEGSLAVPDPNGFGGTVACRLPGKDGWEEQKLTHGYTDNSRGIGAADMAYAIQSGRPQRCHGDLALHVLELMCAFEKSSDSGQHVELETTCERPAALPLGLEQGQLDD